MRLGIVGQRLFAQAARRQNSVVAINSLPPETLSYIFELVQEALSLPPVSLASRAWQRDAVCGRNKWVNLTAVCQHWREVALANPLLWNTIAIKYTPSRPSHTEAQLLWLQRAKSLPLDIYIGECGPNPLPNVVLREAGFHSSHLRRLELASLRARSSLLYFLSPAPLLESLAIGGHDDLQFTELPYLFANDTPRLKHLYLRSLRHIPNTFTSLTHIHLEDQSSLDLVKFLLFIERNASVEVLVLHSCTLSTDSPTTVSTASGGSTVMRLPSLKEVAFSACGAILVREMLRHVDLNLQDATLVCDNWSTDLPETHVISQARCLTNPALSVQALSIDVSSSCVEVTAVDRSSQSVITLSQRCDWGYNRLETHDGEPFLADLLNIMPLRALRELRLTYNAVVDDVQRWRAIFSDLPCLIELSLLKTNLTWLPTLHLPESAEIAGGAHAHVRHPLPALQTLVVAPDGWGFWHHGNLLRRLQGLLEARHAHAYPVRRLHVICDQRYAIYQTKSVAALRDERATLEQYLEEFELEEPNVETYTHPPMAMPESCAKWIEEQRTRVVDAD